MRLFLRKQMENKSISQTSLAKTLNCSNALLSKFFNEDKPKPIQFEYVLKMIRLLASEEEYRLMSMYFKELCDPKHLKPAVEYCSTHSLMEDFKFILNQMKNSSNSDVRELSGVYEIQYNWQQKTHRGVSLQEKGRKIQAIFPKSIECKVFQMILEVYYYYYSKDFRVVRSKAQQVLELIDNELNCTYLKMSYKMRINQMIAYIELKINNNQKVANRLMQEVRDNQIGTSYTAYAYYLLGLTYMYDNIPFSIMNFAKSAEEYAKINQEHNKEISLNKISFAKCVAGDFSEIRTDFDQALYYIHCNENEKAFDILKDQNTATALYIKGKAKQSTELLYLSLIEYIDRGDKFFSNLPKIELIKLGENAKIIDRMQQINMA